MKKFVPVPLLCAVLTACGGSSELDAMKAAESAAPRVVVADIDTAFNPYHEFFYAGSLIYKDSAPSSVTPEVLAEIGVTPDRIIEVTRTGNISKDKKADAAIWGKIRRGKPYWFKGTNVIAVSFCDQYPMLVPDPAKNTHGVGTSAAVLRANPEAVILFVEFCDSIGSDDSEKYAFGHPATDIVTTSYGFATPVLGTPPLPLPLANATAYDSVVKMGKLHFQSAGNGPGITPLQGGPGQWWTVGVSGFEEYSSDGQELLSSNYADFVSDFTQELPYCQDCERGLSPNVGGTSFSCPRSAGVASKVLLEARRTLNHGGGIRINNGVPVMAEGGGPSVTNWKLRRALEEAAYVDYGVADFDPTALDTAIPINDAAPWLQLGWGDLTADSAKQVVPEALAHLGFGTPTRFKGQDYCEYQALNMRIRQNYWDIVVSAIGGGETVPDPNPYLFCNSIIPAL